jgi:hypothetical protein
VFYTPYLLLSFSLSKSIKKFKGGKPEKKEGTKKEKKKKAPPKKSFIFLKKIKKEKYDRARRQC